jgi:hypothetical protein
MRFQPTIVPKPRASATRDFHPQRNETGGAVDVAFVVFQDSNIGGSQLWLAACLHDAQSFAGEIHVITEVAT